MKKSFDCVKMKKDAQRKIYEETKDLSLEEELKYWQKKSRLMRSHRTAPQKRRKIGV